MTKLFLFLLINFSALGIGGALIGSPAEDTFYQSLNKAPWTPPGWVFGAAWFSIMLCFSFFMYYTTKDITDNFTFTYYSLFAIQFVLNVMWNPVFFKWHFITGGLIIIILLTLLVAWFTYYGFKNHGLVGLWVTPYLIWLLIATSLNAYILIKN